MTNAIGTRSQRGTLGAILLVAALVTAGCGAASASPYASGQASGTTAISARILSSPDQLAQVTAHQPTVLLFMATGCVSCVADVNALRQAMASHPGIQAIGVDIVPADNPGQLRSFLEVQGVASAPLLWLIDHDGSIVSRYGVAALGATVGIDRSGAVRFTNPGPSDAAQLAAQLAVLTA